jgi:hypothetical protein
VTHCEMALYILIGAVALISIYTAVMAHLIEGAKKGKRGR